MDFTKPWDHSDIVFIVEDTKIYANKATLSMSSEVFKTMFTAEFAEKAMTEIPLPDKKFDDFLQLMQILHPPHDKKIDGNNVVAVAALSDEYQIQYVFKKCVKVLLKQEPSIFYLNLAEMYNLKELHAKCVKYAEDAVLGDLEDEPGFDDINPNTLIDVLKCKVEKFEKLQFIAEREHYMGCPIPMGTTCLDKCKLVKYAEMCEILK